MSSDQLTALFGQGVQFNVNALQNGKGSGLGLYMAKGLAERHGGQLLVDSPGLGQGTTFTLCLPIHRIAPSTATPVDKEVQPPADDSGCPLSEGRTTATGNKGDDNKNSRQPLRVLVVDDALTNRKLLTRLLQNRGHVCDGAEHGQEAATKVHEALQAGNRPYDTILMDYE